MKIVERVKLYSSLTDLSSTSRRYFVIGFFDGVLTILGMVIGATLSGASSKLIITTGVATALALGISSYWGAFEAERIEQGIIKLEKERALLYTLEDSLLDRAHKFATFFSSFIHGIAPIIGAIVPLLPYIFLKEEQAFIATITICFVSLFLLGSFMGRMAKMNIFYSGVRMFLSGVIVAVLVTLLSPAHFF